MWGYLKEIVYSSEIATLEDLKQKIINAADSLRIKLNKMDELSNEIRERAQKCIQLGGSHFENML